MMGVKILKQVKLFNIIFPIWFLMFFPPVILLTLIGNFIIDSIVILILFYAFRIVDSIGSLGVFYKKSILKVWMFGLLADLIGAIVLFASIFLGEYFSLPNKILNAVSYDPFSNYIAVIIILFAMIVSGILIFILNYNFTFKKWIVDKQLRFKLALTIAIVTIPWTFLLPTKWIYPGW